MLSNKNFERWKNKKNILFGASEFGKVIMDYLLQNQIEVMCFVDNDKNKWGKMFNNKLVNPPHEISELDFDNIIITSMYLKEIYEQLISYKVDNQKIDFIPLSILTNNISKTDEGKNLNIKDFEKAQRSIERSEEKMTEILFQMKKTRLKDNEKIRICFLFQVASFWPSWESFWEECKADMRIDMKVLLFDRIILEKTQMQTSKEFLKAKGIEYTYYDNFDIEKFRPHIIIIQTPYDHVHRPEYLWADTLKSKGYRVVYIPYGIEISDTIQSRNMHFLNKVVLNAWKVYTFSQHIREDYIQYSYKGGQNIVALGHPKFDKLYEYSNLEGLDSVSKIKKLANRRKIILWKIHFPKTFLDEKEEQRLCTPYLREYFQFANKIKNYKDFYFVFMPHPKFYEMCSYIDEGILGLKIHELLKNMENVFLYNDDDYRPGLLVADYIMVDRSAVMVEAGATQKPVLYLHNSDYKEPVTNAIKRLIDSYYQGSTCGDMLDFIEMCIRGEDPNRDERISAFQECIPFFDGLSGYRIKENIINSLMEEENVLNTKGSEV